MSKTWEPKVDLCGDKNYTVQFVENDKVRKWQSWGVSEEAKYEDGEVNVGRIGCWSHT